MLAALLVQTRMIQSHYRKCNRHQFYHFIINTYNSMFANSTASLTHAELYSIDGVIVALTRLNGNEYMQTVVFKIELLWKPLTYCKHNCLAQCGGNHVISRIAWLIAFKTLNIQTCSIYTLDMQYMFCPWRTANTSKRTGCILNTLSLEHVDMKQVILGDRRTHALRNTALS